MKNNSFQTLSLLYKFTTSAYIIKQLPCHFYHFWDDVTYCLGDIFVRNLIRMSRIAIISLALFKSPGFLHLFIRSKKGTKDTCNNNQSVRITFWVNRSDVLLNFKVKESKDSCSSKLYSDFSPIWRFLLPHSMYHWPFASCKKLLHASLHCLKS